MAEKEEMQAFTVRMPRSLVEQIEGRASLMRRSRNTEIISLLEKAIDYQVEQDLKILRTS